VHTVENSDGTYTHTFEGKDLSDLVIQIAVQPEVLERLREATERAKTALRQLGTTLQYHLQPHLRRFHDPFWREVYYRRANRAYDRSYRNQPSHWGAWAFDYERQGRSTHNRRRNKHGRTGVAR
jgi:hypothetical protein